MPRNSTMIFYGPEGSRWALVAPRGVPRGPQGRGRALHPCCRLADPPTCTPSLMGFFPSKNEFREVSGQLDSV